ncbi:transcriptional regulator GlxA family with amidase domain [Streptomyces aurantiacus]|uniref:GlxA family transcriptional regulator n=1 Tax=Streptomyces aurantiacus TaxID=47760 RepID=UPI00278F2BCD|nr:DJ-1/PfpI family protein [Streptomyces aurantiacus]MDQ0771928.1 transcriptional regulator GlxA family with amidase domain [Streptomyces aurantiacus]
MKRQREPGQRHMVVIPLFEGVQSIGFSGPADVFSAANASDTAVAGEFRYDVLTASPDGSPVRTSNGLTVMAHRTVGEVAEVDTVLVPGAEGVPAVDRGTTDALGALVGRARRVASVGTGAFVLAETGILDRRRAATHWEFSEELVRRYPGVHVDSRDTVVRDGHITTAGGGASAIDLALSLVEDDLGRGVSQLVARSLVTYVSKPGGQAQFADLRDRDARTPALREAQNLISSRPGGDLTLRALSGHAGLSERQFTRLFRAQVGMSVREYVERVRVATATRMLVETVRSPETIAREAGFGTETTMRKSFLRVLRVLPVEYRNRFS